MSGTWTKWADGRPTDHTMPYRWRVSSRPILGMTLQPEWTDKLVLCGMGYADNEWWPPGSDWNGYRRSVDPTLEWRPAVPGELETSWHGLDLLPSPFTGRPPTIVTHGKWIGAPPWSLEWIGLESYMVKSLGWTNAAKMQSAWNTRASIFHTARAEAWKAALEEAAKVAYGVPHYVADFNALDDAGNLMPGSPYDRGRYDAATAIRALIEHESKEG